MERRNIPLNKLIEINAPTDEHCSREDYEKYIVPPVKAFLEKNDPEGEKFRCLVTMYGIPLRVSPPQLSPDERKQVVELQKQRESMETKIKKAKQRQANELKSLKQEETQISKKLIT